MDRKTDGGRRTIYRIMEQIGISHGLKRKPNGITKTDRAAQKSDDLLRRDFTVEKPCKRRKTLCFCYF